MWYRDNVKAVLFALARKSVEKKKSRPSLSVDAWSVVELDHKPRVGRPRVLKERSLAFADVERLCALDVLSAVGSRFQLSPKIKQSLLEVDDRMRLLLHDSPLMCLGTTPLDIMTRDASNAFALDKYDSKGGLDDAHRSHAKPESSGFATFPIASYLNHSCQPNCAFSFDMDANIVISTTSLIEEDEELTICYNPAGIESPVKEGNHQSDKNRMSRCKKMCREMWGFECDCA